MGRSAIVILGVIAFALLAYLCINADRFRIQSVVENNAQAAVSYLNEPNLSLNADGRDIILSGQISSQARREQLIDILENTDGVRAVVDNTQALAAIEPVESTPRDTAPAQAQPEFSDSEPTQPASSLPREGEALGELSYQDGVLALTGEIPTQAAQEQLQSLSSAYNIRPETTVTINPNVDSALVDTALLMAEMAADATDLEASFTPGHVTLRGSVHSIPARDELIERLSPLIGERELAVQLNIEPAKAPATPVQTPQTSSPSGPTQLRSAPVVIEQTPPSVPEPVSASEPALSPAPAKDNSAAEQREPIVEPTAPAAAVTVPSASTPNRSQPETVIASTATRSNQPLLFDDCQVELTQAIERSRIEFQNRTNVLTPPSVGSLRNLVDLVNRCPMNSNILIAGHTDNRGDQEMNLRLSLARAQAVAEYFVSQGVEPMRLQTIGFGESRPIDDNTTSSGRQRNRRIEITLLKRNG